MSKVLIIVDMQNDFVTGPLGTPEAQAIVPKIKTKIQEYLERGDTVIFTQDTHDEDYLKTQEGKKLPVPHCIVGSKGWEIAPELLIPRAFCIHKKTFGFTRWSDSLRFLPISPFGKDVEFELVGVCTDICVISNALILKAEFPSAEIVVDARCCAGVTPEKHEAALQVMESCQINIIR